MDEREGTPEENASNGDGTDYDTIFQSTVVETDNSLSFNLNDHYIPTVVGIVRQVADIGTEFADALSVAGNRVVENHENLRTSGLNEVFDGIKESFHGIKYAVDVIQGIRSNTEIRTSEGHMAIHFDTGETTLRPNVGPVAGPSGASGGFGSLLITKIAFSEHDKVRDGSYGTAVYKGKYEERQVAVKKILKSTLVSTCDIAETEIQRLLDCDTHPNVVRYFGQELRGDYVLIALELCQFTLHEWVTDSGVRREAPISKVAILEQAAEGMAHLHSQSIRIVHRDIKPQNILLAVEPNLKVRVKISDFGISRKMPDGKSRMTTGEGSGTEEWMAPEILDGISNYTKIEFTFETDIFSLGCVFYFVLSQGKHPFGEDILQRKLNVREGSSKINRNDISWHYKGFLHLINCMIAKDPSQRTPAHVILSHFSFWSADKTGNFLVAVSNAAERKEDELVKLYCDKFEACFSEVVGSLEKPVDDGRGVEWLPRLCDVVRKYLAEENKFRKYNGASLKDLTRGMRNLYSHYPSLSETIQGRLGSHPGDFMNYWIRRFPYFFTHLWLSFEGLNVESLEAGTQHVYGLRAYYHESYRFNQRSTAD